MSESETETEIIIGLTGGVLLVLSLLPQLFKIIKNKNSQNISILTYIILVIAEIIWCIYGILKNDKQVIIANTSSGIITLLIIFFSLYYRKSNKDAVYV